MIVAGLLSIGWALLVWQWQDPFTLLYTKYEQRQLVKRAFGVPTTTDSVGAVGIAAPVLELRRDEESPLLGLAGLV